MPGINKHSENGPGGVLELRSTTARDLTRDLAAERPTKPILWLGIGGGRMMFAAAVGHRFGRATPSLRDAPQQQSMELVGRETIYRNRNAVQTNPATSPFAGKPCDKCCRDGTKAQCRREHVYRKIVDEQPMDRTVG